MTTENACPELGPIREPSAVSRQLSALFFLALFYLPATASAQTAPDLELRNLQGQFQRLSDNRGHIVVLNFWATWCPPCRKEMPLLARLHLEYAPRGVQFIAASTDDAQTQDKVPEFVRRHRISFSVWIGATAQQQAGFRLASAIPATVILDRDGNSAFRIIGEAHRDSLVQRLEWLLSDRSGAAPPELLLPAGVTPEHFKQHELGQEDEHEEEEAKGAASEVPS